ncbi:DNA-binding CsgD family transcriptional regulator [Kibdelosporangium banguiense]|uniref:DNA-binding CsgD family transcriptional regulator n=1 Tax=Kibdelosporangium banguiense TaxID=1365924 RepID=A0ABS4U1M6_9PSEU|nr:helix-turn-helix domain-containing protein [Kibdelosporangium banguiense]MBP2330559.1 DNA-binding CsgD family transcriptional regulator [Kibdelosporangium banguiense]
MTGPPDPDLPIAFAARSPAPGGRAAGDLWSRLPAELAVLFRPQVMDLTDEIWQELQRAVPAFGHQLDDACGIRIAGYIQQALTQFVDRLADPTAPQDYAAERFRQLALRDDVSGRPILDILQTAYRVGARVAWRRVVDEGTRIGIPTDALCLLAEAIFMYIDELSALAVEGQASARIREAGALERRRRQLLELLLAGATREALSQLSEAARWPLPQRVLAVSLDIRDAWPDPEEPSLDSRILVDLEGAAPCLLVGEEHRELVERLPVFLPGWRAAAGPVTDLDDARISLRWARRVTHLVRRGTLPDATVTWFDDHLPTLWLLHDRFLVQQISTRVLAPLNGLSPTQRATLSETLLIWLQTQRTAVEMAEILSVHPQTVRYRMRQLTRLFGDSLNDIDARFDLEVALRAERVPLDDQ